MKTIKINGKDFTNYFVPFDWKLRYQPVLGNNAGFMLDGSYTEDEIEQKAVITLTCMPLDENQAAALLKELLSTVYPVVEYYDVKTGGYRSVQMRRKIPDLSYWGDLVGGDYWGGAQITLTER